MTSKDRRLMLITNSFFCWFLVCSSVFRFNLLLHTPGSYHY